MVETRFINFEEIQDLIAKLKNATDIEKEWITRKAMDIALGKYKDKQEYEFKRGYIIRFAYAHPDNVKKVNRILEILNI